MQIILDEKSVFTFSKKTMSIHIHTHKDGIYQGETFEEGKIQFADKRQVEHFIEIAEMMVEKK